MTVSFLMPHNVYIIPNLKDKKYYNIEAADVAARLLIHYEGKQHSTKHRILFSLVLAEIYDNCSQAIQHV